MLLLFLAYHASAVAADFIVKGPSGVPLPVQPNFSKHRERDDGTPAMSRRWDARLRRRQQEAPMEDPMANLMGSNSFYTPGKVSVMPSYSDFNGSAWTAHISLTEETYYVGLDSNSSHSWLFGPMDPYKCEYDEMMMGKDYCYHKNDQTNYLNDTAPFVVNFTSYFTPRQASGMKAILNNVSSTLPMDGAKWASVIELADNVHPGGGPRFYDGILGLAKKDVSVDAYPRTPFHQASGWTFFTTYLNMMGPMEELYIGMHFMNESAYTGEMTMLPTSPMSSMWAFDASPDWKVKIKHKDMMTSNPTEAAPEQVLNFPTMENYTETVLLDLGSDLTWIDLENTKQIYAAFGGSCDAVPMSEPMEYTCTYPVTVMFDMATNQYTLQPKMTAEVMLPWGPNASINLHPRSFAYGVDGYPCDWDLNSGTMPMNNMTTCEAKAFGRIQPSRDNSWVYGSVVFQNAFFKWDTVNNGEVSMASYAMMDTTGMPDGAELPNPKAIIQM